MHIYVFTYYTRISKLTRWQLLIRCCCTQGSRNPNCTTSSRYSMPTLISICKSILNSPMAGRNCMEKVWTCCYTGTLWGVGRICKSICHIYDFTYDTCIHTLNFAAAPVSAILVQQSEVDLVGCFPRCSEVPRRSRHGPGQAISKPLP